MKKLPQFVTPHSHPSSFDSGTRPELMAKRHVELGTGYFTVTDHGTMEACRTVYDMCAPGGKFHGILKPILGTEHYFRPRDCDILNAAGVSKNKEGSYVEYMKYMHLTTHYMDEEAFYAGVRLLSKADLNAEKHGSERKPVLGWEELEELGSKNVSFTSSCLIGCVGRHLLQHNNHEIAEQYYKKIRSLVKPGHFYVEIFPHKCTHDWKSLVKLELEDGSFVDLRPQTNIQTEEGKNYASKVAEDFSHNATEARSKHGKLLGIMKNRKMEPAEKQLKIVNVLDISGPVANECRPWAADGDVQLGVNKFILGLAEKYGDPCIFSDDSHLATEDEYIVQSVRLAQMGAWRFVNPMPLMNNADVLAYSKNVLGISEAKYEEWVENSRVWASKFDNFKFSKLNTLPVDFYPKDTLSHCLKLIQEQGRMDWKNPEMVSRLKTEIDRFHRNGVVDLLPYFFIDTDVCNHYLQNGQITGVSRGSAGGVLLSYLMGITHLNPLKYGLSLDRFMTEDRIKTGSLPDIDQDLPSRDLLVKEKPEWHLELENGERLVVKEGEMVQTTEGKMSVEEAMGKAADVTGVVNG